ncbi:MAG: exodeoxyribonuclease VII small subunit [Planctomycetota bacterium]
MSETASDNPPSFEQALERLETIIDRIESGEVGLEDAIAEYEAGVALVQRCRSILDRAEQRISELVERGDGSLAVQGGAPDPDDPR